MTVESPELKSEEIELKTLPKAEDYKLFVDKMVEAGNTAQLKCVEGNVYDLHQTRDNLPDNLPKLYNFTGTNPKIVWVGDPHAICFVGDPFLKSRVKVDFDEDMKPIKNILPELVDGLNIPLFILFFSRENQCFACVRSDAYEVK